MNIIEKIIDILPAKGSTVSIFCQKNNIPLADLYKLVNSGAIKEISYTRKDAPYRVRTFYIPGDWDILNKIKYV